MTGPPYNHSRGDSPRTPCTLCKKVLEADALAIGTDNQRERWHAHLLPEDEICQLARAELFKPMGDLKRWRSGREPIKATDVRHRADCRGRAKLTVDLVKFETTEVDELTHDEWEALKAIQFRAKIVQTHPWIAGVQMELEPRSHWAECSSCHAEVVRSSVRVVVHWAGRELVREYAL